MVLAGCQTQRVTSPAPVEDRMGAAVGTPAQVLPGAENAGKSGFYTVKQGDTLYRIALESGQAWRDVQAWNNLPNPNVLEVGQVLRVAPPTPPSTPAAVSGGVQMSPPATNSGGTPVATAPAAAASSSSVESRSLTPIAEGAAPAPAAEPAAPQPKPATKASDIGPDEIDFLWPAKGDVIATFDEARNKGVSIAGRLGDPVVAAADGRVVYAGAGLRGYGNLIILKHNNTYLTAYAHNQALLVREDQTVRRGQKIAEMGSSDTDRVKLHFEVRRQGKPVDPLTHLPKR
ncbi:peptidoglycan DD-metalloendopeptidase family protein [Hydrogenophaga sp. 5NK40-0174]|uniref:peptidoglycan DD-metalloendopeptidase family protein n=1 Tax=Hydrogenophaga sp. 5NK40-0174 TaxID=3127649 RepID=UPI00334254C4